MAKRILIESRTPGTCVERLSIQSQRHKLFFLRKQRGKGMRVEVECVRTKAKLYRSPLNRDAYHETALLSHDKSGRRMKTRVNHPLLNRAGNARLRTTQPTRKDKRGGVKRETDASFSHGYAKLVLDLTRATVRSS